MTRDHLEAALAELRAHVTDPRAGILGPTSIAWRIGSDLGLFLGGGRAALLQLAHPAVAFAVEQHSRTRTDVTGRFQRTFRNVFAMVFGDLDTAFAAARRVHRVHSHIRGTIPIDVGAWRAGTPYDACDTDSLAWVHATLLDTVLVVRELLDGPLPVAVKDAYIVELQRFARLFGIPREQLPGSYAEHAAYMRAMLAPGRLGVAPCAREMAGFLFGRATDASSHDRPSHGHDRGPHDRGPHDRRPHDQPPLGRIGEAVTCALLPAHLVEAFGFRPTPLRTRAGLGAFTAVYRRLPRGAVRVPAAVEAHRRLLGQGPTRLSAWTERQLFGLARKTTGA